MSATGASSRGRGCARAWRRFTSGLSPKGYLIGLVAVLGFTGTAQGVVGSFDGGFEDAPSDVEPGHSFDARWAFRTDTAFRNVTWFVYLNPDDAPGRFVTNQSVLLVIDGPDRIDADTETAFHVRFRVPETLTGAFDLGVAWDGEYRARNGSWTHVPVTTNAVAASWPLSIGASGDTERFTPGPGVVAATLAAFAAGALATTSVRARRRVK